MYVSSSVTLKMMYPTSFTATNGSSNVNSNNNSGNNGNNNASTLISAGLLQQDEAAKTKMKQQRILLLRHASKCPFGTLEEGGSGTPCPTAPNCNAMKKLWKHITSCTEMSNRCNYPHCNSSKYVMAHYRNCTDPVCACCEPVRAIIRKQQIKKNQQQSAPPMYNNNTNNNNNNSSGNTDPMRSYTPDDLEVFAEHPDPTPLSTLQQHPQQQQQQLHPIMLSPAPSSRLVASPGAPHRMTPQAASSNLMISSRAAATPPQPTLMPNLPHFLPAMAALVPESKNPTAATNNTTITATAPTTHTTVDKKRKIQEAISTDLPSPKLFSSALVEQCSDLIANHSLAELQACVEAFHHQLVGDSCSSTSEQTTSFLLRTCQPLLKSLQESHDQSWAFSVPVDPVALGIDDYFTIIQKPMDLGTIQEKLIQGAYASVDQFASDVQLTFDNAMRYNPSGSEVHEWAKEMKHNFIQLYRQALNEMLIQRRT